MKKFFSLILACILCFAAIPASAFADMVSADELFGVILDADGNIVEYLQMPRGDVYVNSIKSIPAGGSLITLQYTTTQDFLFGFSPKDLDRQTFIVEPDRSFEMSIELSNTIGSGNRETYKNYIPEYWSGLSGKILQADYIICKTDDTNYAYCNGKLVNLKSESLTLRIIIIRNPDTNLRDWKNLV